MELWGALIAGAVVALIVMLIKKGKVGLPGWLVYVSSVGGAVLGYYVAGQLGVAATSGIDWIRWLISVVLAFVVINVVKMITGRKR